jgi:predicted nucleic acid-binding protein
VIHLDTSFLIRALVRGTREAALLHAWLREGEPVAMSGIAWTEFLCGPLTDAETEAVGRLLGDCVPFAVVDAALAARLFNQSGRRRGSLADCMIAAVAVGADAALATANPSDFAPLLDAGLRLTNSPP